MKNTLISWKRASVIGVMVLAGLLTGSAARAEVMTFYAAGPSGKAVNAAYQPVTDVHIGYYAVNVYNGYGVDHTTGLGNSANNYYAYQDYLLAGFPPLTYTFDRPVSIPSLYYCTYLDQRSGQPPGETNVTIRAFADANGTTLLYSNTVAGKGPPYMSNWRSFTGLASLGTNIMRLEFSAGAVAVVDDITVNRAALGALQGVQLQLSPETLQPGTIAQAAVLANYPSSTNDVTAWASLSSSDSNILMVVTQRNLVVARSAGTATITGRFGGFTATRTVTVSGPQPVGLPDGYYLVWSDEFNGAAVDTTKWTKLDWLFQGGYQTPRALSFNGSNLVITSFTENGTNFTGGIHTANKFHNRYGYLEASLKFNDSPGMWSAFWQFIPSIGYETCGMAPTYFGTEIDICEHRKQDNEGNNINDIVASNLHWDGYAECHQGAGVTPYAWGLATGFHVYGLQWDPSLYTISIDGFKYSTNVGVSHCSEYIILDTEVRDNYWSGHIPPGGYGSLATSTTKTYVDYIRYYAPTSMVFWEGSASAYWDNAANWVANRAPQAGNDVVFGYLAAANRSTTLNSDLTLNSLAFMETAGSVSISGPGVLTINGGGIDNISAYYNSTINSKLVVGAAQTWSTSTNYALWWGPYELIIAGQLAGSANLTLEGYGIVRLSASNTFSGALLVNGGTLKVANSTGSATGSGPVTIANAGTLTGNGSLSGPLSLSGTLSPGNGGVGTLTSGAQTWNGGGLLNWEINHALNSAGHDLVAIPGPLTVQATPASKFTVKLLSLNGTSPGTIASFDSRSNYTWTVATASGGIAGFAPTAFTLDTSSFSNSLAGGAFTLEVATNSLVLKFHPATEQPQFTGFTPLATGSLRLSATAVPGKAYTLQATTNLLSPLSWLTLTNLTADAYGWLQFTNFDSTNHPRRFYRLTAP